MQACASVGRITIIHIGYLFPITITDEYELLENLFGIKGLENCPIRLLSIYINPIFPNYAALHLKQNP